MPVPSSITDLSTTLELNSPAGTETPSSIDNYLRAHAKYIADMRAVIGGAVNPDIPNQSLAGLSDASDPTKGAALIGYKGRTVKAKIDEFVSIKDFGAVGDGVTDDTAAIQAALDYGNSSGLLVVASGEFLISSTLTVRCNADFSSADILCPGTVSTAILLGSIVSSDEVYNLDVKLPRTLTNTTKPGTGWVGQGIGVTASNLYSCHIQVGEIFGFSVGLLVQGIGTGNVHNNYYLGHLYNNKTNLSLTPNSTGWANQNTFIGGRLSFLSSEGSNVSGTSHIYLASTPNSVNNNTFLNCSIEGNTPEFHVICGGIYNSFIQLRWEATTPKVNWLANYAGHGSLNVIDAGYGAQNIVYSFSGAFVGAKNKEVNSDRGIATFSSTGQRYANASSSANAVIQIYEAGTEPMTANPTSDWSVSIASTRILGKRKADVHNRVRIDFQTGFMWFDNGTQASERAAIGSYGGTHLSITGSGLVPAVDNAEDMGLSAVRWRNAYANTIRPGAGTVQWTAGAGTPEGVLTAVVGSLYTRTDGGAATTLYVKETGTGNTGWVSK